MSAPDETRNPSPLGPTLLRLEGRDALELLHRVTTQTLRDLSPGRCRATLLCDFRGRLQHRMVVAATSDGAIWLLRDDAPGEGLAALIGRQVFREDVRLEDRLNGRGVSAGSGGDLEPGALREQAGEPVEACHEAGTTLRVEPAGARSAARGEHERIRLALPRHGFEIREEFNPLEVGLARDVHLDKGCFTGQESLLRIVMHGGSRRRLVRLAGPGPAPEVPDRLRVGAEVAGALTSASPEGDGWIGLGVLRRDAIGEALVTGGARIERCEPVEERQPLGLPD